MDYVLGFLFSPKFDKVALIKKTKPAWQKGRYNGIGGKIEPGETAYQAMVREFEEEAGVKLLNWKNFGVMGSKAQHAFEHDTWVGNPWNVDFFVASSNAIFNIKSQTEEEVFVADAAQLPDIIISNISWLVPLAKNFLTHPELHKVAISYDESAKQSYIVEPFSLPE